MQLFLIPLCWFFSHRDEMNTNKKTLTQDNVFIFTIYSVLFCVNKINELKSQKDCKRSHKIEENNYNTQYHHLSRI